MAGERLKAETAAAEAETAAQNLGHDARHGPHVNKPGIDLVRLVRDGVEPSSRGVHAHESLLSSSGTPSRLKHDHSKRDRERDAKAGPGAQSKKECEQAVEVLQQERLHTLGFSSPRHDKGEQVPIVRLEVRHTVLDLFSLLCLVFAPSTRPLLFAYTRLYGLTSW